MKLGGRFPTTLLVLTSAMLGCGGNSELGQATAAACPDASTLTWQADIAPIMNEYCVTCHGTTVAVTDRHGAPTDHNFDTELGVLQEAAHVDQSAGSNGNVTNTEMPPKGYPAPSVQQRMELSEWLSCNAPMYAPHTD